MSTKDLTHKAIAEALAKNTPLTVDQRATLLTAVNDDQIWQRRHDEMAAELNALRADAERYRWLRKTTNFVTSNGERVDVRNNPELWDKSIDDCIAKAAAIRGSEA